MVRVGRRLRSKELDICWLPNDVGHSRLGLVVPRYGRSAVARNKLKRWLREIARRRLLPRMDSFDLVLRTRPTAYRAVFGDLSLELEQWLSSLSDSHEFPAT